jgi:glycosyltransferase involved in cell wall biosynthesis
MIADLLFYPMTKKTQTYWCCSPMKIFEYMATGIPILSSNVGSVSEVLNHTNSIPFDPEDEQSIIDGVNFFLKKNEEAKQRAKKALQDVRKQYTWYKRAKEILETIA